MFGSRRREAMGYIIGFLIFDSDLCCGCVRFASDDHFTPVTGGFRGKVWYQEHAPGLVGSTGKQSATKGTPANTDRGLMMMNWDGKVLVKPFRPGALSRNSRSERRPFFSSQRLVQGKPIM